MQRLEVSGTVRPIYGSLGVKRLTRSSCPTALNTRVQFQIRFNISALCSQRRARASTFDPLRSVASDFCNRRQE